MPNQLIVWWNGLFPSSHCFGALPSDLSSTGTHPAARASKRRRVVIMSPYADPECQTVGHSSPRIMNTPMWLGRGAAHDGQVAERARLTCGAKQIDALSIAIDVSREILRKARCDALGDAGPPSGSVSGGPSMPTPRERTRCVSETGAPRASAPSVTIERIAPRTPMSKRVMSPWNKNPRRDVDESASQPASMGGPPSTGAASGAAPRRRKIHRSGAAACLIPFIRWRGVAASATARARRVGCGAHARAHAASSGVATWGISTARVYSS